MSVEKYLRLHIHFHAKQQQQSMFGDRVKKGSYICNKCGTKNSAPSTISCKVAGG